VIVQHQPQDPNHNGGGEAKVSKKRVVEIVKQKRREANKKIIIGILKY
jgi:hypothetical protein